MVQSASRAVLFAPFAKQEDDGLDDKERKGLAPLPVSIDVSVQLGERGL
jgi:hypothetical protein